MPCGGCMKRKAAQSQGDLARGLGGYLATFALDDGIAYSGDHAEENVYCVGRLTHTEKFFRQDQLAEASAHSRGTMKTLISQPAALFPQAAMVALFEPAEETAEA